MRLKSATDYPSTHIIFVCQIITKTIIIFNLFSKKLIYFHKKSKYNSKYNYILILLMKTYELNHLSIILRNFVI